jgi:hypothetical protein
MIAEALQKAVQIAGSRKQDERRERGGYQDHQWLTFAAIQDKTVAVRGLSVASAGTDVARTCIVPKRLFLRDVFQASQEDQNKSHQFISRPLRPLSTAADADNLQDFLLYRPPALSPSSPLRQVLSARSAVASLNVIVPQTQM